MTSLLSPLLLGSILLAVVAHRLLLTLRKYNHKKVLNDGGLRQPPVVPYLIPWIGHSVGLTLDTSGFLRECRKNYGEIYKLIVGGSRMVIVSSPETIYKAYTSPKSLVPVHEEHVKKMCRLTDMSEEQFPDLFKNGTASFTRAFSPRNVAPLLLTFNDHLRHEISSLTAANSEVISLEYTLFTVMKHSISRAVWGEEFPMTPDADKEVYVFMGNIQDVRSYLPISLPFYAKAANQMHDRVTQRMSAFYDRVVTLDCMPEVFQWTKKFPSLTPEQRASVLSVGSWAVLSNLTRAPFWILAYLLLDEGYVSLQNETRHTITTKYGGLERFLSLQPAEVDPSDFELLDSGIQETLRHVTVGGAVRRADRDTVIPASDGQYLVEKDEMIMIDTRGMHFDSSLYGPNAASFQMDRFVKRSDGSKAPPLPLAFALGPMQCKGAEFSLYTLRTVVITFMDLYDASPMTKTIPSFSKLDCMGVHRPTGELLVQISPRRLRAEGS